MSSTRRLPTRAIAASFFGLIALISWAFATPIGSAPDDDFHLASIWCAQGTREGLCEIQDDGRVIVDSALLESVHCLRDQHVAADCTDSGEVLSPRSNSYNRGYPPVYYFVQSFLTSTHISGSALLIRTFNALLAAVLIGLMGFLASAQVRAALLTVTAFGLIPLGLFIISSTNPSSWAVIAALITIPAVVMFMQARSIHRMVAVGAMAFISVIVGAGARTDAAAYAVLGILAGWLLAPRLERYNWKRLIFLAALIVLAFGLYKSGGSAANLTELDSSVLPWYQSPVLWSNLLNIPSLWMGAYGDWGLGWLEAVQPGLVRAFSWGAVVALVVLGFRYLWRGKLLAVGILTLAAFTVPLYVLQHDGITVGVGVQPRYILPLLIMIMFSAVLTQSDGDQTITRAQSIFLVALAAIANSAALHQTMRRYISGLDVSSPSLNRYVEWWWIDPASGIFSPLSPMVVWGIGSFSFIFAALLLLRWIAPRVVKKESVLEDIVVPSLVAGGKNV